MATGKRKCNPGTDKSSDSQLCELQPSFEEDNSSGNASDTCQSGDESATPTCMYMKHQQHLADNWTEVRDQMLHAAVECEIPSPLSTCILCKEPATVTFKVWVPVIFCVECTEALHYTQNIFHIPQLLKVA